MAFLVDTNVLSEMRKPSPDPNVLRWMKAARHDGVFVSVLVLGEIRYGIERARRRDPAAAESLEAWLRGIYKAFEHRIVGITADVADVWGRINSPRPLPETDALMAATALVHDWTYVTRNTKHVERTGVRLLNPFEDPELDR